MLVGAIHVMMLLRIVERDILAYRDNDNPTSPRTKGMGYGCPQQRIRLMMALKVVQDF